MLPENAEIYLTHRCNLKCRYCYLHDANSDNELTTREWIQVLRQFGELKIMRVLFSGGEPLLRNDFFEIVAAAVSNRMRFGITSNGTLFDDAKIDALLPYRERCDYVQISIDGPEPIHDMARGKGSFQKMTAGVARLRAAGFPLQVKVTIGKHNIGHLMEVAETIFDELKFPYFGSNLVSNVHGCAVGLYPDLADLRHLFAEYEAVLMRYPNRILAEGPYSAWRLWRKLAREQKKPEHRFACAGDGRQFSIMPDGNVVRCSVIRDGGWGNVREDKLSFIWRKIEQSKIPESAECMLCEQRNICPGKCPCDDYLCLSRYLKAGGTLDELAF